MLSRLRFKLHSVYDTGVEVQEDQRDNDGGLHYAELSQQESAAHKVRMGAETSLGSSGSISWVCQPSHLLFLAHLSLTLSRSSVVFTKKI